MEAQNLVLGVSFRQCPLLLLKMVSLNYLLSFQLCFDMPMTNAIDSSFSFN
jgi:hypothetical protein